MPLVAKKTSGTKPATSSPQQQPAKDGGDEARPLFLIDPSQCATAEGDSWARAFINAASSASSAGEAWDVGLNTIDKAIRVAETSYDVLLSREISQQCCPFLARELSMLPGAADEHQRQQVAGDEADGRAAVHERKRRLACALHRAAVVLSKTDARAAWPLLHQAANALRIRRPGETDGRSTDDATTPTAARPPERDGPSIGSGRVADDGLAYLACSRDLARCLLSANGSRRTALLLLRDAVAGLDTLERRFKRRFDSTQSDAKPTTGGDQKGDDEAEEKGSTDACRVAWLETKLELARALSALASATSGWVPIEYEAASGAEFRVQALELRKELFDGVDDHGEYAESLCNVGLASEDRANVSKAFEMLQRLHGDRDHPQLAAALNNEGCQVEQMQDFEEGIRLMRMALDMRRRLFAGLDHVDLALSLNNVGRTLHDWHHEDQALPLLREASEMLSRLFADFWVGAEPSQPGDHPFVANAKRNYGTCIAAVALVMEDGGLDDVPSSEVAAEGDVASMKTLSTTLLKEADAMHSRLCASEAAVLAGSVRNASDAGGAAPYCVVM